MYDDADVNVQESNETLIHSLLSKGGFLGCVILLLKLDKLAPAHYGNRLVRGIARGAWINA